HAPKASGPLEDWGCNRPPRVRGGERSERPRGARADSSNKVMSDEETGFGERSQSSPRRNRCCNQEPTSGRSLSASSLITHRFLFRRKVLGVGHLELIQHRQIELERLRGLVAILLHALHPLVRELRDLDLLGEPLVLRKPGASGPTRRDGP